MPHQKIEKKVAVFLRHHTACRGHRVCALETDPMSSLSTYSTSYFMLCVPNSSWPNRRSKSIKRCVGSTADVEFSPANELEYLCCGRELVGFDSPSLSASTSSYGVSRARHRNIIRSVECSSLAPSTTLSSNGSSCGVIMGPSATSKDRVADQRIRWNVDLVRYRIQFMAHDASTKEHRGLLCDSGGCSECTENTKWHQRQCRQSALVRKRCFY